MYQLLKNHTLYGSGASDRLKQYDFGEISYKEKTFLVGSVQPAKLYTYDDHLSKSNIHSLVLFVLLMHLFCTQKTWVNGQFLLAIFS